MSSAFASQRNPSRTVMAGVGLIGCHVRSILHSVAQTCGFGSGLKNVPVAYACPQRKYNPGLIHLWLSRHSAGKTKLMDMHP